MDRMPDDHGEENQRRFKMPVHVQLGTGRNCNKGWGYLAFLLIRIRYYIYIVGRQLLLL